MATPLPSKGGGTHGTGGMGENWPLAPPWSNSEVGVQNARGQRENEYVILQKTDKILPGWPVQAVIRVRRRTASSTSYDPQVTSIGEEEDEEEVYQHIDADLELGLTFKDKVCELRVGCGVDLPGQQTHQPNAALELPTMGGSWGT